MSACETLDAVIIFFEFVFSIFCRFYFFDSLFFILCDESALLTQMANAKPSTSSSNDVNEAKRVRFRDDDAVEQYKDDNDEDDDDNDDSNDDDDDDDDKDGSGSGLDDDDDDASADLERELGRALTLSEQVY